MGKKLVINQRWCKGCSVCVAFCPKNILKLEKDKICVTEPEKCIFCKQCELRCPDYAIYVEDKNEQQ
jgi:2-oxoglutarate ferredoxin oxidoreductase subunit delta